MVLMLLVVACYTVCGLSDKYSVAKLKFDVHFSNGFAYSGTFTAAYAVFRYALTALLAICACGCSYYGVEAA